MAFVNISYNLLLMQLSSDASRAEELTLRQCMQLIPVMPSMPKTSVGSLTCSFFFPFCYMFIHSFLL